MRRVSLALAVCWWGAAGLWAQTVSPEEGAVRAIYAKLSIAWQIRAALDEIRQTRGGHPVAPVVTLTNFDIGPLSKISDKPYSSLVSRPTGWVLNTGVGRMSLTDDSGARLSAFASSRWYSDSSPYQEWDMPLSKLLGSMDASYDRFASFNVLISYEGRLRQYAAIFFFGKNEAGRPTMFPADQIIGPSPLAQILLEDSFPGVLMGLDRNQPATVRFLKAVQAPSGCTTEAFSGLCCDPAFEHCGIEASKIQAADAEKARLTIPCPKPTTAGAANPN